MDISHLSAGKLEAAGQAARGIVDRERLAPEKEAPASLYLHVMRIGPPERLTSQVGYALLHPGRRSHRHSDLLPRFLVVRLLRG